jgi:hypothetical protein
MCEVVPFTKIGSNFGVPVAAGLKFDPAIIDNEGHCVYNAATAVHPPFPLRILYRTTKTLLSSPESFSFFLPWVVLVLWLCRWFGLCRIRRRYE